MIRIGAIGLGDLGRTELELYDEMDDVEVVAGADVTTDARDAFEASFDAPAYDSYQTLLAEQGDRLDAVNVVTPHTLHYEQTTACLERDINVFLEKPMVTDIQHAHDLVEMAETRDLILQVGYQRHFHPAYQRIKELIDEGEIGDVHTVNCFLGQDWIRRFHDVWRAQPELSGGGQLYDSGSHLIDTLLWTTGTEPRQVASVMDYRDYDIDVNTALAATLERDGHPVTASIGVTADGTSTSGTEEGLFVWGTEGRLAYHASGLTLYGKGEGETDTSRSIPVQTDLGFRELANRKLTAFVKALRGEREPAVTATYGLMVTAFTEAAYRAKESGEVVDVSQLLESPTSART